MTHAMELAAPTDPVPPDELANTLLEVALTGFILFRPVYDAQGGDIVDFTYEYLNPAAQQMLRLPARPTGSLLRVFPAARQVGVLDFYRQAFLSGQRARHQFSSHRNGVDEDFYLVAQRQGERLVVSLTDASQQSRSVVEDALHESQAREQAARQHAERQQQDVDRFFEQAPVAISLLRGPRHIVELMNATNAALLGSTPGELLGRPIMEALPVLRGQGFDKVLERVLAGETIVFKEIVVTLDRAHLGKADHGYYHVTYQPWRAENGEVIGAMTIAVEVTEQVQARQQLEQLNHELEARVQQRTQQVQAALDAAERQRTSLAQLIIDAPAAICVLAGPDFVFELANPRYQALFAGRLQVGRPLLDVLPELVNHPIWHSLRQVYETGRTQQQERMMVAIARPGDGMLEERYFTYTQQARHNEHGQIDGILVFAYEVTEQELARQQVQRLNNELTTTNQQLTRTNVDLDNFIYTASHDLRQPISNIEGLLRLLEKALPDTSRHIALVDKSLAHMRASIERFKRTIAHLTEVSKLQVEFAQPAVPVRLDAIIEDVRQDLLPLLTATGGQLDVAVDGCRPRVFSEKNLRSIVYNLLSNALKYHHPERPPRVRISCATEGGRIILRVQDNGLGMNESQQARLFQLFQRMHTHVEGSGLGLYMVKKIVENAGGTIQVESQVNVGTTFALSFPA